MEAQEISAQDLSKGCAQLEALLETFYWVPTKHSPEHGGSEPWPTHDQLVSLPRKFDPDPRAVTPDFHFDEFAAKCVRHRMEVGDGARPVDLLLESPLLLNLEQFQAVEAAIRKGHEIPPLPSYEIREGTLSADTLPPSARGALLTRFRGYLPIFRSCYEMGLRQNPNLSGTIAVRFVIDKSGYGVTARDAESNLPDAGVIACVVNEFRRMKVTPIGQPATGIYRLILAPK